MFFLGYQLELLHDKSALKKNTYKNTRSDFASECFKAKKNIIWRKLSLFCEMRTTYNSVMIYKNSKYKR